MRLPRIDSRLVGLLLLAACSEDQATSPDQSGPQFGVQAAQGSPNADPGREMRHRLRSLSDHQIEELMATGGNIVMVGFRSDSSPGVSNRGESRITQDERRQRLAAIRGMARRVVHEFQNIPAIAVELEPQAMRALRRLPWVDYIAPNTPVLTPDVVSVTACALPPQSIPWNITRVGAPAAWQVTRGNFVGSGARVLTVLDDGVDEGNGTSPGADLYWSNYQFFAPSTSVDGDHGTKVLSAAAARDNGVGTVGVAPAIDSRIAKIFDLATPDYWVYAAVAIDQWAAASHVISLSYSTKQTSSQPPAEFAGLYDMIRNAYYQHGTIIVASTGNQSRADYYAYPARYAEVVGVGGSGTSDEWVYNNYAPGNVEVAAPAVAVGVICKGGGSSTANGTSFGTPMVAGAFMLLRAILPNVSNDSLRAILRNTAVPMSDQAKSGAGRIDVGTAITGAPTPPPISGLSIEGPACLYEAGTYTYSAISNPPYPYTHTWYRDLPPLGDGWKSMGSGASKSMYFAGGNYGSQIRLVSSSGGHPREVILSVYMNSTGEGGTGGADAKICSGGGGGEPV